VGLTKRHHYRNAWAGVGANVERSLELSAVADLTASQMEVKRIAVEISFEVDFAHRHPWADSRLLDACSIYSAFRTQIMVAIWVNTKGLV
jgi:hypothetical protein